MRNNNLPRNKGSLKQTQPVESSASREVTPFIKILDIFTYRLHRTLEEASTIVSTSDLSFFHNLSEGDKMELAYQLALSMLNLVLFSLLFLLEENTSWPWEIFPRKWVLLKGRLKLWR